jgi:hypothetical protein
MAKKQVLQKMEHAWKDFNDSWSGLNSTQMLTAGVVGDWSVKDLIAHVSWWEEETLEHLPEVVMGIRPQRYSVLYGGLDAFNALMTEKWRPLSLSEVQQKAEVTHAKLLLYLETVPEDFFLSKTRFYQRLRWDTFGHYPLHARAIRDWRAA